MIRMLLLVASFGLVQMGFSQGLQLKSPPKKEFLVKAGKVFNFSIGIVNESDEVLEANPLIELPEGWRLVSKQRVITVPENTKKLQLVSVIVPSKVHAGNYQIKYQIQDDKKEKIAESSLSVIVEVTNKLEVIPLNSADIILAGKKITGVFLVKNRSNQTQVIQLFAGDSKILGPSILKLNPFQGKEITIEVSTSSELRSDNKFGIYLTAMIEGEEVRKTAFLHTQVLANHDIEWDDTRRLPGFIGLNFLHRKFGNNRVATGFQGELFLQGNMDTTNRRMVTLSLRGPSQQESADLTLYDEYYASIKTDKFSATIGDNTVALSTLTEFSRNGRGLEMEAYKGTATIGGFFVKPRFFGDLKNEVGLFVQNEFSSKTTLRFNYLRKKDSFRSGTATLLSLLGRFQPFKHTNIEGEIAAGNRGEAAHLQINSRPFSRLRLNGTFIYASPHFEGYFQNTLNVIGNINYKVNSKISALAGIFKDNQNASLDTLFQAAPITDRQHVGLQLKYARRGQVQVTLRKNNLEDRMPQKQFFREENLWALNFSQGIKRFQLNGLIEIGKANNLLSTQEKELEEVLRSYVDVTWRVNNWNFKAFAHYFSESSILVPTQKQLLYGVSIGGRWGRKANFQLRYQNDFEVREYYKNRNAFELFWSHRLGKRQRLVVNARQSIQRNTLNNRDFNFSAKYIHQFGIPLEPKKPTGEVLGHIKRKNGKSTKGIVVYLNGKTAVTDKYGNFKFKSIPPGEYHLLIEPSSLALHEMIENQESARLLVEENKENLVEVQLIQSGSLYGNLEIKGNGPAKQINKLVLGGYMVQISNEKEVRRAFTDENGTYEFKDLRPGKWKLQVMDDQTNKQIAFSKRTFFLEIQPGEEKNFPISLNKKKRNIQFKKLMKLRD